MTRSQSINGTGTAAPAGDASDSGRVADRDTNAGATPARTLPSHTEMEAMDAKTLKALRGSIAKWEGIVAGTIEDKGPSNCPLCQQFIDNDDCAGCPVAMRTGQDACSGSPYDEWADAEVTGDPDRLARAAQAELDFLKSLLPPEAQSDDLESTGKQA